MHPLRVSTVDDSYYQVATPGSLAERLVVRARDAIFADFLRLAAPGPESTILDVGVSDVVGEAANVLERLYAHPRRVTAVGLGQAQQFQAAFPDIAYRQIQPGERLPFADGSFDIATSNAVLEHVGSEAAQAFFVGELARVARLVFITVPHRFFPVEHHTGIPLLHWMDGSFAAACRLLGKEEWTQRSNLILMSMRRLRRLGKAASEEWGFRTGMTGIRLGPCSSNLYLVIERPDRAAPHG